MLKSLPCSAGKKFDWACALCYFMGVRNFFKKHGFRNSGLSGALGLAGNIGLHMVSGVLAGFLIGYWLDKWLDTSPWLKLVFFILGVVAGFRNVYLDAKILLREQEEQNAGNTETKN
jgi:ATP synthase protein I